MRRIRRHLTYANVMVTILALSCSAAAQPSR
jgi:hypothetical protein